MVRYTINMGTPGRPERESAWQDDILAVIPSGLDAHQLDEFAKLSPTERLEQMRHLLVQLEESVTAHGNRLPRPR